MANLEYAKGKYIKKESKIKKSEWELFNVFFEIEGEQKSFTCFDSLGTKEGSKSFTLNDLKENEQYSIGYSNSPKGTTIMFIGKVKEKSMADGDKRTQTTSKGFDKSGELKIVKFNKDSDTFKQFNEKYKTQMEKEEKEISVQHYTGVFIRKFKDELGVRELVEWLEEECTKMVK